MQLKRSGTQASVKGPEQTFTGNVRIDPLFTSNDPWRSMGVYVTFEPGARSAWRGPNRHERAARPAPYAKRHGGRRAIFKARKAACRP